MTGWFPQWWRLVTGLFHLSAPGRYTTIIIRSVEVQDPIPQKVLSELHL
jgi:hypothetical protein